MKNRRTKTYCGLLALIIAGCSRGVLVAGGTPSVSPAGLPAESRAGASGPRLYAGDLFDRLSVYLPGRSKPRRSVKAVDAIVAIAIDDYGNLFAADGQADYGKVVVYRARDLAFLRRIEGIANPISLAVDPLGYLYVANGAGVFVYPPGGSSPMQTLRSGGANAIAFDPSGNLYVANVDGNAVNVFAPTKMPGRMVFSRKITNAIKHPYAVTVSAGQLFVANWGRSFYNPAGKRRDTVTEYSLKSGEFERVISEGVERPVALAADSDGTLYVGNLPLARRAKPGWVGVYSPGKVKPLREITDSIDWPVNLTTDSSDNLYVANEAGGSVTEYTDRGATLLTVIKRGVKAPDALFIARP